MGILYLQYDPMAVLSCQIDGLFRYDLLTLAKGNIMEILVVECEGQLLSWNKTDKYNFKQKHLLPNWQLEQIHISNLTVVTEAVGSELWGTFIHVYRSLAQQLEEMVKIKEK